MVGFWGGGKETQYVFMAGKEGADGMDGLACVRVAGIELFVLPVPSGWEVFFFTCRDFLVGAFWVGGFFFLSRFFVRVFLILRVFVEDA